MRNIVKVQYKKPRLELCNANKVPQNILTDRTNLSAYNIVLNQKLNETSELTFTMPFENVKLGINDCEKLIKLNNDYYIIKEISINDSTTRTMDVRCVHESEELKGILCQSVDVIGATVSEMYNAIMDSVSSIDLGYTFIGTDIADTTMRALQEENEVSVYENLVAMAKVFQAVLEFSYDSNGNKQIYLRKDPIDRGKYVKKASGLKQLNISYDSTELFTRLSAFGATDSDGVELTIHNVNPSKKSYVENYEFFLAKGLTIEEILATPRCCQEMIFRDSNLVDENDLYRVACEELAKCSVPVLNGSIDMADLSIFEGSSLLAPILNEKIIVIDKDINFSISSTITAIERNYDNPLDTKITISNVVKYDSVFKNLIHSAEKIDKVTTTNTETGKPTLVASAIKGKINGAVTSFGAMLDSIESPQAELAILFEDRIVGSPTFGATAIGTRGLLISNQLNPDGSWNWATAINGNGIYGSEIVGHTLYADKIYGGILKSINEKTWINMEDGTFNFGDRIKFDENGFSISLNNGTDIDEWREEYEKNKADIDKELEDMNGAIDNLGNTIGDSFKDGIISEVEFNNINRDLLALDSEKEDIDTRYDEIYYNIALTGTPKKNLDDAYGNFVIKFNNLKTVITNIIDDRKATPTEITQYENALSLYNSTIPTLTTAFDNALTNISENKAKTQISDLQTLLDEDIKNVADSLTDLEDTMMNSFKDGIISEAEYIAILENLTRLESEKSDIDKNYNNIYNNSNLKGECKTSLKNAYDEYKSKHSSLTDYINNSIGDRVATEEEIAEIRTKLSAYDGALSDYGKAQINAINNIAENSTNASITALKKEINDDIKDVSDELEALKDDIGGVILDGILDETEMMVITNSINELNKEKADIDERFTNVYSNDYLKGSAKTTLYNRYVEYVNIHSSLVIIITNMADDRKVDDDEKTEFNGAIEDYNDALGNLSKAFDSALNKIAENMANSIMESLRQEVQENINDVHDIIDDLDEYINNAFKDGILTESEKDGIRTYLKTLEIEKTDIDFQYTTIYNNDDLIGSDKTSLKTAYTTYTSKYTVLKTTITTILNYATITDNHRTKLDTAFTNHNDALAIYSQSVNIAINSIAEKKKQDALQYTDDAKEELQGEISDVNDAVNDLDDYIEGAFKDGVLTEAEKDSIRTYLKTLESEKADIDRQYNVLYNNTNLKGTPKSSLKTAYDGYVSKYNSLVTTIENILSYTEITDTNRTNLDTAFANHDEALGNYSQVVNEAINSIASTYTDVQFKVLDDRISSKVSTKDYESYVEQTAKEISSKISTKDAQSLVEQTEKKFTLTFKESGGNNLIKNSSFNHSSDWATHWWIHTYNSPQNGQSWTIGSGDTWGFPDSTVRTAQIRLSNQNNIEFGLAQRVNTKRGQKYTFSFYYSGHRIDRAVVIVRTNNSGAWLTSKSFTPQEFSGGNTSIEHWGRFDITFTAQDTGHDINIVITSALNDGYLWIAKPMINEGSLPIPWCKHKDEIINGLTTIDGNGITVSHSNISTKTQMTASGFFINDKNGDVVAELSASDTWSKFKADEIYAKNIDRVYTGNANLYITHSNDSNGNGTSSDPFNSFEALRQHFKNYGTIVNKNIKITINSSKEITETFILDGLRGTGTITITYNANCVHRCDGWNIVLNNNLNPIIIKGGRTSYNTSDGAILCEASDGSGINITDCHSVIIEYISIDRTNWGVRVNRSNVRCSKIDFCNCWCAIEANRNSLVSCEDCCGNAGSGGGGDAFRSYTGSMITYGHGTAGHYVPKGKRLQHNGGLLYLGSGTHNGTSSFRNAPPKPSTSDRVQTFSSTGYGYYSIGQACWNPYGQKVYQGNWGYGNNKGIYTLPNSDINSFYSGSTIVSGATIELTRASSAGYSSAQTVYLCGTTTTTVGSGSNPPVTKEYGSLGTLGRGETKTFTLPSGFVSDLKAGTIKSIMFYTSDGSNYILFENSCSITLKCNK